MQYPSGLDLFEHLIQTGIIPSDSTFSDYYNDLMLAAINKFETDTGWTPFLNESTGSDSIDDYPEFVFTLKDNYKFILPNGAIAIQSIIYNDEELEEGVDYIIEPLNSLPKRRITFMRYMPIILNGLRIRMKEGYTSELPGEVKLALLDYAVVKYIVDKQGEGGDLASVRQGEVSYTYGGANGITANDRRLHNFGMVVAKYRRHLYG